MPRLTERQEDANTLLNAFIVHLLAQMEADAFRGADSESNSEAGTSDGEDSEDYSSDDPITKGIIKSLEELHKNRYAGPRTTARHPKHPGKSLPTSQQLSQDFSRYLLFLQLPTLVSHQGALMTLSILSRTTPSF